MAYFGELRGDVSPRIRITKEKPDFDRRLESYNNGFNINVSRIKPIIKEGKESMLAYSERVRNVSRKTQPANEDVSLEVRAHQVYKKNKVQEKIPERKVMTFQQLIGKRKERKERPQSLDEITYRREKIRGVHGVSKTRTPRGAAILPSLPDKMPPQKNLKVSFVNASDLYDFVDCSIRQSGYKKHPLGNLHREYDRQEKYRVNEFMSKADIPETLDSPVLPPITVYLRPREETAKKENNNDTDKDKDNSDNSPRGEAISSSSSSLPTNQLEQLKIRPRRAKRMKLPKSGLDSIPETDRDREASHLSSFRWASSQQPLYIPSQTSPDPAARAGTGSPRRTVSPRAEKYSKTETDSWIGRNIRPQSDPLSNGCVDSDQEYEFDYERGYYEQNYFPRVSDEDSNRMVKSPSHQQNLVFLKDTSSSHSQVT